MNQQRKIVGIGYNTKPAMISNEEFAKYWKKREIDECSYAETKYPYGENSNWVIISCIGIGIKLKVGRVLYNRERKRDKQG